MKRLQILIEEELDEALQREAANTGTSKAALIRQYVRERLRVDYGVREDPIHRMTGVDDYDPAPIDDIVYR